MHILINNYKMLMSACEGEIPSSNYMLEYKQTFPYT